MFKLKHQPLTNMMLSASLFISITPLATATDYDCQDSVPYGYAQCFIAREGTIKEIDGRNKGASQDVEKDFLRRQKLLIQQQYREILKEDEKDYKKALDKLDSWFVNNI
jgi:hypothetical protein